jgi:hypothetical protein
VALNPIFFCLVSHYPLSELKLFRKVENFDICFFLLKKWSSRDLWSLLLLLGLLSFRWSSQHNVFKS